MTRPILKTVMYQTFLPLFVKKSILIPLAILTSISASSQTNSWSALTGLDGVARYGAAGFAVANKIYLGTGADANLQPKSDFWEYDPENDTWTQKANFEGGPRLGAITFTIDGKGYLGLGYNPSTGSLYSDIWEYDPVNDDWIQKADFEGAARFMASAFVIGSQGYVVAGAGLNAQRFNDLWVFDPGANEWTSKTPLPGGYRSGATAFSIGDKGYVGTGTGDGFESPSLLDFWEYDVTADSWMRKADFPRGNWTDATGFSLGSRGYIVTGGTYSPAVVAADTWEYDPIRDVWRKRADYPGVGRLNAVAITSDEKAYVGTGAVDFTTPATQDFYVYTPPPPPLDQTITFDPVDEKIFGDGHFSLTAMASSDLPVTFISSDPGIATINGSDVTIVGAGTTTITALQDGNEFYNPAPSVSHELVVGKAPQIIAFDALSPKTFGESGFDLIATTSSGLTVSYTISDELVAVVSGNAVSIIGAGTATIAATQSGNSNYLPAAPVNRTLTIVKAHQSITFPTLDTKPYGSLPFDPGATASSGMPVVYSIDNTQVATITGNTVTLVGPGSAIITATQSGNANYNPASATTPIVVIKGDQTITFDPIADKTFGDEPFEITAVSNSGLPIAFNASDPTIAVLSGSTITINGMGSVTVAASQSGNSHYHPAEDVTVIFCINPPKPTITSSGAPDPILESSSESGNQWFTDGEIISGETSTTFQPASNGTYQVKVTIGGCTSEFSDDCPVIVTGIEHAAGPIGFYPNPVNTELHITGVVPPDSELVIYNMNGFEVLKIDSIGEKRDIQVRNFSAGIYLMRINTGGHFKLQKFVKQ